MAISFSIIDMSCSSNGMHPTGDTDANQDEDTLPPVETNAPNSTYKPAFEGQTRIAGMKTHSAFDGTVVTTALSRPWGITTLPDGRFLITQKEEGTMVIVAPDGTVSNPITGLPKVDGEGQGGLLGLTLDPDFTNNRMIYWSFSERMPKGNLTAVAKGRLADDEKTIENAKVIYRATPAFESRAHFGGRLLFGKDGNLFVSTGERASIESRPQAQQLNSALGKILRITTDGKPAKGNPFENDPSERAEIWSYGHRNVQGLAWNPENGDLWETEFGPLGGDELNRIVPGKNYGWGTITYGLEYSGKKVGEGITTQEGMEQPVYYWDPVISPSGIIFYTGDAIPEWKNNLFICGLSSNYIARLRIENNRVTGEERLLADQSERFRDITQGKDGNLYAVTDGGKLYKLGK